jgi:hypothetical protein
MTDLRSRNKPGRRLWVALVPEGGHMRLEGEDGHKQKVAIRTDVAADEPSPTYVADGRPE